MDFKVLVSDQALKDLSDIIDYISRDNPEASSSVGQSLIDHLRILESFPYAGEFG